MKLTPDEARDIIFDCHEDWLCVDGPTTDGKSRWSVRYTGVWKHVPSGEHYRFDYSKGATEQQDEQPYQDVDEVIPTKVVATQVMVTQWLSVK